MSYCISISKIDHLPNETTILIRYVIGCTGTWDLETSLTAYRGVCDDEWTLMSPNYQHPQHTDLPITITSPGYNATFAWNYGGIPGISSEDFNPSRSYLTQLGIYNLDCYYTGQPSNTGSNTGVITGSNTGTTGSSTGSDPGIPIDPVLPGIPRPTHPTIYVSLDPSIPDPSVGVSIGTNEPDPNGNTSDPVDPARPDTGLATGTTGNSNQGGYHYEPIPSYGTLSEPNIDPNVGAISTSTVPTSPAQITYNQLYTQTNTAGVVVTPTIYIQTNTTGISATRPNGNGVGTVDPMTYSQSYTSTNAVNTNQNTTGPIRTKFIFNKAVIDSPVLSNQDNTNNLERNLYGSTPMERVRGTSIDFNSYLNIITPYKNIFKGSPVPISIVFSPSTPTICKLELYAQDNKTSILIGSTEYSAATQDSPIKYGMSVKSGLFKLGDLIFTVKILDQNNNPIAVKSVVVANIDKTSATTSNTFSNRTNISTLDIPYKLSNYCNNKLLTLDITLDLLKTKYLILSKVIGYSNSTSIIVAGNDTTDKVYLKAYNSDGAVYPIDGSGDAIYNSIVRFFTEDRIKIHNSYWYPETHNVGILNFPLSDSEILVEISNTESARSTQYSIFVSENYRLKTPSLLVFNGGTLISGTIPYALEDCGLIVYGKTPGFIGSTYTIYKATSNRAGAISFENINISKGEYYAIFSKTNGIYNPHKNTIYSSQY